MSYCRDSALTFEAPHGVIALTAGFKKMSSSTSSSAGSSPARLTTPPTSLTTAQACITPPSQRRREARLLRCQYIRQRAAAADAAGREADQANQEPPTAYAPEVVAQRRAQREVPWHGWEAEAEAYAGERFVGQLDAVTFAQVDGNVNDVAEEDEGNDFDATTADTHEDDFAWEDAAPELAHGGHLALGFDLGGVPYETYLGVDAPSPVTPSTQTLMEGPTMGLLLCALYVLWRAIAAQGPSRPRAGSVRGKTAAELTRHVL